MNQRKNLEFLIINLYFLSKLNWNSWILATLFIFIQQRYYYRYDKINQFYIIRTDGYTCLEKSQFNVKFRRHSLPTFNVHVQLRRFDKGERESGQRYILGPLGGVADGQRWTSSAKKSDNCRDEVAQSLLFDGRQIFPRFSGNFYRGNVQILLLICKH